jgi:hypothetical protein
MMNYLVAFMFPFFAGWSMVAANALWDAPDRPPVLWGAGGRMLMIAIYILTGLLLVTGMAVGTVGLLLAYVIAWVFAHPDQ